jgi:hypothetical protein
MRALILTAAVLIAGSTASEQATAADRSPHHANIGHAGHGASLTLVGHRGHGHGYHGYHHGHHGHLRYGHGHPRYGHYAPFYLHRHGCGRPVIVRPPVVYRSPYPYGFHSGYGYYHGGVRVNTGRVGFSIAF